jgi:hypothetical protein
LYMWSKYASAPVGTLASDMAYTLCREASDSSYPALVPSLCSWLTTRDKQAASDGASKLVVAPACLRTAPVLDYLQEDQLGCQRAMADVSPLGAWTTSGTCRPWRCRCHGEGACACGRSPAGILPQRRWTRLSLTAQSAFLAAPAALLQSAVRVPHPGPPRAADTCLSILDCFGLGKKPPKAGGPPDRSQEVLLTNRPLRGLTPEAELGGVTTRLGSRWS